nr:MAG TPA: hypothetical protein [Caudoviricetes sp.]
MCIITKQNIVNLSKNRRQSCLYRCTNGMSSGCRI